MREDKSGGRSCLLPGHWRPYLQVSRSTVDLAYEQLLSEGYIESAPYRGYFVCEIDALYPEAIPPARRSR